MSKFKYLSEFDKGQIVMAKRQSISKMAGVVGCFWYTVASTYQMCALLTWRKDVTRMHYGKKHNKWKTIESQLTQIQ